MSSESKRILMIEINLVLFFELFCFLWSWYWNRQLIMRCVKEKLNRRKRLLFEFCFSLLFFSLLRHSLMLYCNSNKKVEVIWLHSDKVNRFIKYVLAVILISFPLDYSLRQPTNLKDTEVNRYVFLRFYTWIFELLFSLPICNANWMRRFFFFNFAVE